MEGWFEGSNVMPDRSYPNIFSQGRPLTYSSGGKVLGGELQSQVRDENGPAARQREVGNFPITGGTHRLQEQCIIERRVAPGQNCPSSAGG